MTNPSVPTTPCPTCGAASTGKFCAECGSSLAAPACRNCATQLPAGARFCNACGTAVGAAAPARRSAAPSRASARTTDASASPAGAAASPMATYAPWGIAAVGLVAVVAFFAGRGAAGGDAAAAGGMPPGTMPPNAAPFAAGAGGGAAPDISSMSPRERAGRLYDRVMQYAEQGKRDSVDFFAPMAMASFELLGSEMDLDARYDFGRVAAESGVLDVAAAQADTMLMSAPTHLLGLALAASTADRLGQTDAANRAWRQFLSSRESELRKNLPEYQAHAADIDAATRAAQGR